MNSYVQGQLVRIWLRFKNASGTLTDPTTVTVKVEDPSGNTDTYTYALSQVIKDSTGVFYYDVTVDEKGVWYYRGVGTGTIVAAGQDKFTVIGARPA